MRRKQFAVFGVGACTCVLELFCASASAPAPAPPVRPVISVHLTATYHDATVWKEPDRDPAARARLAAAPPPAAGRAAGGPRAGSRRGRPERGVRSVRQPQLWGVKRSTNRQPERRPKRNMCVWRGRTLNSYAPRATHESSERRRTLASRVTGSFSSACMQSASRLGGGASTCARRYARRARPPPQRAQVARPPPRGRAQTRAGAGTGTRPPALSSPLAKESIRRR